MIRLQATGVRPLAGVPASTHTPLAPERSRSTILHGGWHGQFPWCPTRIGGKDIDLPYHIAMAAETTLPTGIDPAAWFMPMAALWASLTGIVLVLQHQPYPVGLSLVLDIGADFAVMPLANFLVALSPQVDTISDIPDITKHDSLCLAFHRDLDNGAAHLVCQIAHNSRVLGFETGLGTEKLLATTRALPGFRDSRSKRREPLGMALACGRPCTATNDGGFVCIPHHGGMDFAQINTDRAQTRSRLRLCPVFDDGMPRVAVCLLVVDQPNFKDTQHHSQSRGQGEDDGTVALARGEGEHCAVFLDGGVLPDSGTEPFAPVGEFGRWKAGFPQGAC